MNWWLKLQAVSQNCEVILEDVNGKRIATVTCGDSTYKFSDEYDVNKFLENHPELINSEWKKKNNSFSSKLREMAKENGITIIPGSNPIPVPNCNKCRDSGWLLTSRINGDLIPCICKVPELEKKRVAALVEKSRLGPFRDEYTFDKFIPRTQKPIANSAAAAKIAAMEFAKRESPESWLVIYGDPGTGKSHLGAAIINTAIDTWNLHPDTFPLFYEVTNLLMDLRNSYNDHESNGTYYQIVDNCKNTPLLVLDDLGTENQNNTGYANEQMYIILNHRYKMRLPTVVTTNLKLRQLESRLASRFTDRAIVLQVYINEKDYRPEKATR